jgi:LysR family glycine cleavage system transcriptional activator
MSRLPPLSAIRAFEVSARRLSFTEAATELHVTQSAVSRHIRHLEDHLGLQLFIRRHRALVLTPEGERYRDELSGIFRRLSRATDLVVRSAAGQEMLHIHAYTTFAMYWLIPRIRRFQEAYPGVELQLTASTQALDIEREQVHAVIRIGAGNFEGSIKLFPVNLIPICSPRTRATMLPSGTFEDLKKATLLHSLAAPNNWPGWLESVGLSDLDTGHGLRFESSAMTYLAARKDLGVAIGQREFIQEDLQQGALLTPFKHMVIASRAFYLVCLPQYIRMKSLRLFQDWVLSEVDADQKQLNACQDPELEVHYEGQHPAP